MHRLAQSICLAGMLLFSAQRSAWAQEHHEEEYVYRPISVSFVPGLSTNIPDEAPAFNIPGYSIMLGWIFLAFKPRAFTTALSAKAAVFRAPALLT